jgi:hypothetical protein
VAIAFAAAFAEVFAITYTDLIFNKNLVEKREQLCFTKI